MSYNLSERLATNFTLAEVVQWPRLQATMTPADRQMAERLAIEALNPQTHAEARRAAQFMQTIRDAVNRQFPQYGGRIGIRVTSWLRHREWEIFRGRSGDGQHPTGHAVDITVTGVPDAEHATVMEWIWNNYQSHNGGLARLFRNGRWSFIHFDFGARRRWEY